MFRFRTYLEKTFSLTPTESEEVMSALVKPLTKSIRINTHKISREDFLVHAREQEWILTETDIPEVFLIDREDTSLALGRTLEHQAGWFYIQELAAAHPPYLLKEEIEKREKIKEKKEGIISSDNQLNQSNELNQSTGKICGTILDMCASPGGKTTQLADYFPESLIIANEVNRSRTPQLFDNLDRMGYENVAVVSCDGRFFQNFPEYFDAVLLDAPCSGEGTAFRDSSVIEHWHEKNIHRIAKLQKQLFETAMTIVKPGGFISYSTCTLNTEENEHVICLAEEIQKAKYKKQNEENIESIYTLGTLNSELGTSKSGTSVFEKLFEKRFWPHIEHTGGFFASIFQKKSYKSIPQEYPLLPSQGQTPFVRPATKGERETVERFVAKYLHAKLADRYLFISKDGVYANSHNLGPLMQYFFFVHAGARIGTIKGNIFTPTQHIYWHTENISDLPRLTLTKEECSLFCSRNQVIRDTIEDGYYVVQYGRGMLGVGQVTNGKIDMYIY